MGAFIHHKVQFKNLDWNIKRSSARYYICRGKKAEFKFIHRLGRTCSLNIGNIKRECVVAPVSVLHRTIKTTALQINNKSKGIKP